MSIPVGQDDQIIRTDPVQGIAAYIVLPQPVWQELQALCGQRMQVLHPLQIASARNAPGPDRRNQFCRRLGQYHR
ncbi:MAG: hypothetical protein ACLR1G_07650 [Alistipes indistinctus]